MVTTQEGFLQQCAGGVMVNRMETVATASSSPVAAAAGGIRRAAAERGRSKKEEHARDGGERPKSGRRTPLHGANPTTSRRCSSARALVY